MQAAICWCWSTEESRNRWIESDPMGTSDCRWKQDRDIDENSETCRVGVNEAARYVKDTAEQVIPVSAEVWTRPKTSTTSSCA